MADRNGDHHCRFYGPQVNDDVFGVVFVQSVLHAAHACDVASQCDEVNADHTTTGLMCGPWVCHSSVRTFWEYVLDRLS